MNRNAYWLGAIAWTTLCVVCPPLAIAIGWVCGDWRYGRSR